LISTIGPLCPNAVRPFLSVAQLFLAGASAVLVAVDHGRGVYISMSWFAPGAFIPTSI
jgi:hypothetical protein